MSIRPPLSIPREDTMTEATTYQIPAHRPGPNAWAQLVLAEMRMVIRDTAGLVVPLGMPVLILVMFGLSAAGQEVGIPGLTALDVYVVPLALVIVMCTIGVVNMPSFLAAYRRAGVLRRLGVTPAHPSMVLVAQVVTSAVQTFAGIVLAVGAAHLIYGLNAPRHLAAVVGLVVLIALAMYAVGMLVAAISPTPNSAVAIGLVAFFGMGATGGLFGPVENLPEPVARLGEVLPFGAGVQALQAAWSGQPVDAVHLVSLVVTTVVASVGAALWFRWE